MNEPVRILSDLHLGHKISRIAQVSALRPLIAGAGTVVFNGDTWQELARPFRERSAVMLAELKTLCAEEGAEAVFLSGNHDPSWPGPGWIVFAGAPWKREILNATERVTELWQQHPDAENDADERLRLARAIARDLCSVEHPFGRSLLQRAWDAAMPPKRALRMLESWFTQGTIGSRFCDRYFPQAEMLVIGHFHCPGTWLAGRRRIINTGSFMDPCRAQWAEWNNGWLTRGAIDESQDFYRIGRTLDIWRF